MNIDLFSLRAFLCLANALHFGRAAAELNISSSRLTRTIQGLEQQIGAQLFARTTHSTVLTPAGNDFIRSAQRIVSECDWIGHRFNKPSIVSAATFTVGCLAGTLYDALPERVRAARLVYPKLQIKLVELEEQEMTDRLLAGAIDVAFLYFPTPDDEIACRMVARRSQWVAMSQDNPLARMPALSIADLRDHVMILPDEINSPRLHRWYRAFLEKGSRKTFKYVEANQIHVALGLCAAGEGLCVIAENLMDVRRNDLHYIPLLDAPPTELMAIWRKDSPVRQVAQFIGKWPS